MAQEPTVLVTEAALRGFAESVMTRVGLRPADAAIVADVLVHADLRGVHSHGCMRLPYYVKRIEHGLVDPVAEVELVSERPGAALVDAHNCMGHVAAVRAAEVAIRKARETGSAFVGVAHSNHCGACSYFAMLPLPHDMIGICATVAGNNMAPTGGREKIVGNNPIAFAIPTLEEPPLVLDIATSVVAQGKLQLARLARQPIPPTWALDREGNPTTDPFAADVLQPIAGYKGYGLALVLGLTCGVLTGSAFGRAVPSGAEFVRPQDVGHWVQAVAVDTFRPAREFRAAVDAAIREMRNSERAPGVDRIYVPGEIEAELEARRRREGIPLAESVHRELVALAEHLGIPIYPS